MVAYIHASRLPLHVCAGIAEHEREMIAEPTKAALAASKARGTLLGTHGKVLAEQRKAEALDRLAPLVHHLRALRAEGLTMRGIADRLNAEGVVSAGRRDLAGWERAPGVGAARWCVGLKGWSRVQVWREGR